MGESKKLLWSRYNLLFQSERNGWLLYNSASNSFISMADEVAKLLKEVEESPENMDFSDSPDLYFKLRGGGFLVEEGQDDHFFRILKMRRQAFYYSSSSLTLTIALTRDCNFACGYCYEPNRTPSHISDETENNIIKFIEKRPSIKKIHIIWYGGEPLLDFERIKSLTKRIKNIGKDYDSGIITNGYLLKPEIIQQLNELNISFMQITLDGSKETHDKRRFLKSGGKTFDKIVENMDNLAASDWRGTLMVRTNIDTDNKEDFASIYRFVEERYPEKFGKEIYVYPGFVHGEGNPDTNCYFDSGDKGQFLAMTAKDHGINALPLFPHLTMGGCTMNRRNAYVAGPNGELYKCWNDLGIEKEVVGTVDQSAGWNMGLIAEGMIEGSYLEDRACGQCFFFPICDGGCAKMRVRNRRDQGNRDTCSYFKKNIKELLEIHYEQKQRHA